MNEWMLGKAQTFDEWVKTYDVTDDEERDRLAKSAEMLLQNSAFRWVFSRLEAKLLQHILDLDLDADDLMQTKMMILAMRSLKGELRAMSDELQLSRKQ